jgi:competence protein ComEA
MIGNRKSGRALASALVLALGLAVVGGALAADPPLQGVVNVNTASVEELQLLPGIGEARARAILEVREHKGGFRSVDELVEVKGIGAVALERLRPYATVKGKTTARIE